MCSLEEANEAYRYIGLPGYNPHVKKDVFFKYYDATVARDNARIEAVLNINKETIEETVEDNDNYRHNIQKDYLPGVSSENVKTEQKQKSYPLILPSDKDKILLINSRRVFHIAEEGRNYQEREDLARSYFDKVSAVEADPEAYKNHTMLLQIYILNKNNRQYISQNMYGFRPVSVNSYLFHRLIKNGFLCGSFDDLKKNIDWNYLPLCIENKEEIQYICCPSYFKRKHRERLSEKVITQSHLSKTSIEEKYRNDYNWVFWPDLN